jgi:hypothetical protein
LSKQGEAWGCPGILTSPTSARFKGQYVRPIMRKDGICCRRSARTGESLIPGFRCTVSSCLVLQCLEKEFFIYAYQAASATEAKTTSARTRTCHLVDNVPREAGPICTHYPNSTPTDPSPPHGSIQAPFRDGARQRFLHNDSR